MKKLPALSKIPKPLTERSDKLKEIKDQLIARISVYQKKKKKLKGRKEEFKDESKGRLIVVGNEDSLKEMQQYREQIMQMKKEYEAKNHDMLNCKGGFYSDIYYL
jgi:chemotaxis response regulator CheB